MKTVTNIAITSITPNPLNPRKHFDPKAIEELAKSIESVGVLQPITVRPIEVGYELVCGERRWRAAAQAGLDTIPSIIRKLTDEQAMDITITENLQRKDVDPFEEADAFHYLIDKGQSFDDIAARFGKSTIFVRGRIKLLDIIFPLRILYNHNEINISHCLELCKFSEDVQHDIYNTRYCEDVKYYNWRDISLRELRDKLDNYLESFEEAEFDKTECMKCPKNSAVCGLFPELDDVSCTDRVCFRAKVYGHKLETAVKQYEENPELLFYEGNPWSDEDKKFIAELKERGVSFVDTDTHDWRNDMSEDKERARSFKKGYHATLDREIYICPKSSDGKSPESTAIKELKDKDKRNKEISEEKTLTDVREYIKGIPVKELSAGEITDHERTCMLYFLIKELERDQQKELVKFDGWHIPDATAWTLAASCLPDEQAYIYRCTILNEIGNRTRKDDQTAIFLHWVDERTPGKVAQIEQSHQETYLKRKEKIDAKIAEIELEQLNKA